MRKRRHKSMAALLLVLMMVMTACGTKDEPKRQEITGSQSQVQENITDDLETSIPEDTMEEEQSMVVEDLSIEEQVILDQDGVVITALEMVDDSLWGKGIKLLIENNSDQNIGISFDEVMINDYMISDLFVASVAAGKKANETWNFSQSALEKAEIDPDMIGKIEILIHVYDGDSYETIFDAPSSVIQTSGYERMEITPLDEGQLLFDQDGIRIVGRYLEENDIWGNEIVLYLENKSGRNVGISCEDVSINGFMVNPLFVSTVFDQKMAIDEITISPSDLEENGIDQIQDVELKFHIYDADSYESILDSEAIQFTVD